MSAGHTLDDFVRSLEDGDNDYARDDDFVSSLPRQRLHPSYTTWMITFGTHAARLHGGPRATVDRDHNQRGEAFINHDPAREVRINNSLKTEPVILTVKQCCFIEETLPAIIDRGGWILRACAASPPPKDGDHVHVLLDSKRENDPDAMLELIKRWLTQALNKQWPPPDRATFRGWWAEKGSAKPVKDAEYLNNAFRYVVRQRATPRKK